LQFSIVWYLLLFFLAICGLPHSVEGDCKAMNHMWTYDAKKNECIKFIYGGCKGNKNKFKNLSQCRQKCVE
ncbi:hypothetical protein KR222_009114, partial [Zaprionus bogoriensis]